VLLDEGADVPDLSWIELSQIKHDFIEAWSAVQAAKMRLMIIEKKLREHIDKLDVLIGQHEEDN
jgi:hypothetical protein